MAPRPSVSDPDCVLGELHRLLRLDGALSFRDPYMKEEEILAAVTGKGWFRLSAQRKKTYRFTRVARDTGTVPPPLEPEDKSPIQENPTAHT